MSMVPSFFVGSAEYRFAQLSQVAGSGDVNSLLQAAITQSGNVFTVQVDGGAAYTDPKDGAYLLFPMTDVLGELLLTAPLSFEAILEVDTAPSGSSAVVVAFGVVDGTNIDTNTIIWGAIDWDGVNPRVRTGQDGSFNTAAADSGIVKAMLSTTTIGGNGGPDLVQYFDGRTSSFDSTNTRINSSNRTTNLTGTNQPHLFVSVFGSALMSGPFTVAFSLKTIACPFPGAF